MTYLKSDQNYKLQKLRETLDLTNYEKSFLIKR